MRKLFNILLFSLPLLVKAADKDSTITYQIADSIRIVQFYSTINIPAVPQNKNYSTGIQSDDVKLLFELQKGIYSINLVFPKEALVIVDQPGTKPGKQKISFPFRFQFNTAYNLLLSVTDSSDNYTLYSGYVWLPEENKWKMIGSVRLKDISKPMKNLKLLEQDKYNGIQHTVFSNTKMQTRPRMTHNAYFLKSSLLDS